MKTLIIYDQCGQEALEFYLMDCEWSKINGIYINNADNSEESEKYLMETLEKAEKCDTFPLSRMSEIQAVAICGFLP